MNLLIIRARLSPSYPTKYFLACAEHDGRVNPFSLSIIKTKDSQNLLPRKVGLVHFEPNLATSSWQRVIHQTQLQSYFFCFHMMQIILALYIRHWKYKELLIWHRDMMETASWHWGALIMGKRTVGHENFYDGYFQCLKNIERTEPKKSTKFWQQILGVVW